MVNVPVVRDDFSLDRRPLDDRRLRRRRRRGARSGLPLSLPFHDPNPAPLNIGRWQRPRRRRPLPLSHTRAKAVQDRRWAGRALRPLDDPGAQAHPVKCRTPTGAPYPLPRVIVDPRADLLMWWSRAQAPRPHLEGHAFPRGRRGPRAGSRPLDSLNVTLTQDQRAGFWPAGFLSHKVWHPRLPVYVLTDRHLHITAACGVTWRG